MCRSSVETLKSVAAGTVLLWRRAPFTTVVVAVMLGLGIATGALWSSVEDRSWYTQVSYGLPALESGKWWTFLIGPFFALTPIFYLPMAGTFALFVGYAEARIGIRRTVAITVAAQLVTTLGAPLVLLVLRGTGWGWAEQLSLDTDVGFSAGALAAAVVVSATIRAPWRLWLRVGLCLYVGVSIVSIGTLADLEHLLAVTSALPLAQRLAGPVQWAKSQREAP